VAKEHSPLAPFVISRQVDAPRDRVWKAWSELAPPVAFREIVPPERLVWVQSSSDEAGPRELLSTLTLTEREGKTTVQIEQAPIRPTEAEIRAFDAGRGGLQERWSGTLDKLVAQLAQ
jgi:uncharacterized protein YndB with AHSA1/START domain